MSATTLSEVEAEMAALLAEGDINDRPWVDPATLPPTDLPSDDGEPMESPWHAGSGSLLKAAYVAARGGVMTDYYVGVNMFVYYSWKQVRNLDFKGPDMFFANDVEGQKPRLYWAIWDEDGREAAPIRPQARPIVRRARQHAAFPHQHVAFHSHAEAAPTAH